jgi:hypothetical protein
MGDAVRRSSAWKRDEMLRLIGAAVVVLLIAGPLLVRVGVRDQGGFLREFVDLETRLVVDLLDWIRALAGR